MKVPSPTTRRRARIEIIPLIDVVFFLLATFVMVSLSMVKNQGISVNLPVASTGTDQEPKQAITISVNDQGDVYFDKTLVTLEQVPAKLRALKAADPGVKILINGDEKAHFGKAVGILDEVRKAGIAKVSIRTKGLRPAGGN